MFPRKAILKLSIDMNNLITSIVKKINIELGIGRVIHGQLVSANLVDLRLRLCQTEKGRSRNDCETSHTDSYKKQ